MRDGPWLAAAVVLVTAVAFAVIPYALSYSQKEILVFLVINVLVVASYRFLTLTGEWSLGHVVMVGVGAYASAILSKRFGLPVPASIALGSLTAAAVAWLLSFPLFRMKGFYFLIGSFAAGEVIRLLWKRFREPFGGPKGLKRIPEMPGFEIWGVRVDFFEPVTYYYFCMVVVAISLWVMWRLERSPLGLTFHAVHWRDSLAASVGVDTRKFRTMALVIASFFAGLAGALFAHYVGTINPNLFDVEQMVYVLTWAIVGGTTTIYGPVLGVVLLTILNEVVLREMGFEQARPLIYGAILIAFVLFLPKGLESLVQRVRNRWARRAGADVS